MASIKVTTTKRSQRQASADHLFVPHAFRRSRLPWMFYGLLPSLLLDCFLLVVVLVQYPQLIATGAMAASDYAWETAKVFLVNAIFLKVAPIYWYLNLQHLRTRSYIRVEGSDVAYLRMTRERVNDGLPTVHFYHVFSIHSVTDLKHQKDGAIVVQGEILVKKFSDADDDLDLSDEKKIPFIAKKQRLVLPGYFENMDEIFKILQSKHASA